MEYLHRLLKLPQITISQLQQRRKSLRNTCTHRPNLKFKQKLNFTNKNGITVKQPFYIDRSQQYRHHNCHQNGKCLACEYQKLKQMKLTEKKQFISKYGVHNKINYNFEIEKNRKKTQCSQINFNRQNANFRSSQGAQPNVNFSFENLILNKIQSLTPRQKQQFYKLTSKYYNDPQVFELFIKYLQQKKYLNDNKQATSIKLLLSLQGIDFKKQFMNQQFLRHINKKLSAKNSVNEKKKKLQSIRSMKSIKTIRSIGSRKKLQKSYKLIAQKIERKGNLSKQTKQKGNKKKKVKIADSSSDSQQIYHEAKDIYTQLFGNKLLQEQLNEQIKQSLSNLSNKRYRMFRKTLTNLDQLIGKRLSKQQINQKIVKKLQSASSWMKYAINQDDEHQMQKCKDIDQFLNLSKNANRKSKNSGKRKNGSQNKIQQYIGSSNSSIGNSQTSQYSDQSERKFKSNRRNSKKRAGSFNSSIGSNQSDNQQYISSSQSSHAYTTSSYGDSSKDRNSYISINSNTSKNNQKYKQKNTKQQIQSERGNGRQRKFHKKSQRRSSIMTKRNSYPQYLSDSDIQSQQPITTQKKKQIHKIQDNSTTMKSIKSIKRFMRINYSNLEPNSDEKQKQQIEDIKDKKKIRKLLKIKVTELLKNNNDLILRVQQTLKRMNQSKLIIKQTDCVLTQKKKIRALLQLIKIFKGNNQDKLKQNQINQIMVYLSLYEQTCRILTDKKQLNKQNNFDSQDYELNNLMNRNQHFHQFKFFNLNTKFTYGQAQDQDMQFTTGKTQKKDQSWQIQCKQIQRRQSALKVKKIKQKIGHQKAFSQLIQTDMNSNLQNQLLIMPKNKVYLKTLSSSIQQKPQHSINSFKIIINENKKQRRDFYKKYYPNTLRKSALQQTNNLQTIFQNS